STPDRTTWTSRILPRCRRRRAASAGRSPARRLADDRSTPPASALPATIGNRIGRPIDQRIAMSENCRVAAERICDLGHAGKRAHRHRRPAYPARRKHLVVSRVEDEDEISGRKQSVVGIGGAMAFERDATGGGDLLGDLGRGPPRRKAEAGAAN